MAQSTAETYRAAAKEHLEQAFRLYSGDRWKNLSRTLLNLADRVIRQGEAKWNSR